MTIRTHMLHETASLFCVGLLLLNLLTVPSAHASPHQAIVDNFDGRDVLVYVPSTLPPEGTRALVVVLHGGLGNASRIEDGQSEAGINMDDVAEKGGFIVAYLNGTQVLRLFGRNMLGWNAGGGCCGQPAQNNVDDVGYITSAVRYLSGKYGINPKRIFGMGHSNGAMMTQRLMCETNIYAAAVPISGPLNLHTDNCPSAHGKKILAIHGSDDQNVPLGGGQGTKGPSKVSYTSEEYSRRVFTNSGATYNLQVVNGADHKIEHIDQMIQQTEGISLAEKIARFFGLL